MTDWLSAVEWRGLEFWLIDIKGPKTAPPLCQFSIYYCSEFFIKFCIMQPNPTSQPTTAFSILQRKFFLKVLWKLYISFLDVRFFLLLSVFLMHFGVFRYWTWISAWWERCFLEILTFLQLASKKYWQDVILYVAQPPIHFLVCNDE